MKARGLNNLKKFWKVPTNTNVCLQIYSHNMSLMNFQKNKKFCSKNTDQGTTAFFGD